MKHIILIIIVLLLISSVSWGQDVGDLVITSNIKNADIFLNGEKTEQKTPAYFTGLTAGEYVVELVDIYDKRTQQTIEVKPDEVTSLKLNFEISHLVIKSNVVADTVYINDPGNNSMRVATLSDYFNLITNGNPKKIISVRMIAEGAI